VVLEVVEIDAPKIQGQAETGQCVDGLGGGSNSPCLSTDDCIVGEFCQLPLTGQCEIPEWQITLENVPKTPLANTLPFNSVTVQTLTITYGWASPDLAQFNGGSVVLPLGITIPAEGTGTITFPPISSELLDAVADEVDPGTGATATLTMLIAGKVADSDSISVTAGATLVIDPCFVGGGP
jgi:hypothetical protein